ncbi:MAG: hypothetical protein IMZ61_06365 [Planctomycetes bacterium]|nr:hypothetical protein [Planctomycetota bacterium]
MRIIKDEVISFLIRDPDGDLHDCFHKSDTIELTDDEMDEIFLDYVLDCKGDYDRHVNGIHKFSDLFKQRIQRKQEVKNGLPKV